MKSQMMIAAQIAQTQLPRDDLRGFQVGLEDGVVEIAQPDKTAGVHVHGGHRFGLVDDQVAARFQVDAFGQGAFDLFLDTVQIEQRTLAWIVR